MRLLSVQDALLFRFRLIIPAFYANFAEQYGIAVTTYHKVKTTFMPHELATVMLYDRFFWRKFV